MAQSKISIYPRTFKEKCVYYGGKIFCYGANLIGVSFYNRFMLWNQPYLSDDYITMSNLTILYGMGSISQKKRKWHFKATLIESFVIIPSIFGLKYLNLIEKNYIVYLNYGLIATGCLLLNHYYGIITHTYNEIRINNKVRQMEATENYINEEILSWTFETYENDHSEKTYIIMNAYFHKIYFIFSDFNIANDFYENLKSLSREEIIDFASNDRSINKYKSEFIKNRFTMHTINGYVRLATLEESKREAFS